MCPNPAYGSTLKMTNFDPVVENFKNAKVDFLSKLSKFLQTNDEIRKIVLLQFLVLHSKCEKKKPP